MNPKNKLFNFIIATCTIMFVSSCNTTDDFDLTQIQSQLKTKSIVTQCDDFKVSEHLLHKYLSIKKETPTNITPIIIDGDTLAYLLEYVQGWKLISGDQRLSPIISQSDNGTFKLGNPNNPETRSLEGLLNYIKELRNSNNGTKNPVWKILTDKQTQNHKIRKIKPRGIGTGMWIPIDTTYITDTDTYPHVIATSWHQSFPYNIFCPIFLNKYNRWENMPVGCSPVAVGQVVYHYRKNNNRNIAIPIEAIGPDATNTNQFIVTNSSSEGWNYLSDSHYIAMFLRDIGKKMKTKYGTTASGTSTSHMSVIRSDYLLNYALKTKYDYSVLISSLRKREPVIIVATSSKGDCHMFIVDGYKEEIGSFLIRYEWDQNHYITEEEFNRYPQEMFKPDPHGDTEKIEEIPIDINTYITMNWGWQTSNSTWYLAHEHTNSYQSSDFAGSFDTPSRDRTYDPYWSTVAGIYNSVSHMYYNFQEFYPGVDNSGGFVP